MEEACRRALGGKLPAKAPRVRLDGPRPKPPPRPKPKPREFPLLHWDGDITRDKRYVLVPKGPRAIQLQVTHTGRPPYGALSMHTTRNAARKAAQVHADRVAARRREAQLPIHLGRRSRSEAKDR
jgi:hypothetical protein